MNNIVINEDGSFPIKAWVNGVSFEEQAQQQLRNIAKMPFVYKHVAVMPDVHYGLGATIGTVFASKTAVIPSAVGVDIGCGMLAAKTNLTASMLPDSLSSLRSAIEATVPHGWGKWGNIPRDVEDMWLKSVDGRSLADEFNELTAKHSFLAETNNLNHLGTLGGGNHFIEICLDENQVVWVMLHSGSRGVGNRIGTHFIEVAKNDMLRQDITLPDADLAYLQEGSDNFNDYVSAVGWAQKFAKLNRHVMLARVILTMEKQLKFPVTASLEAISCHHNYISHETHFGEDVIVTRKGAVSAKVGEMGIIPGSMGAKSFIVRGLGNPDSFCSCSHGAGRVMSRTKAKKLVNLEQHVLDTAGVECKKDESVLDETPSAYKSIDAVMAAQSDLVEIAYTLKQILCVKG